MATTPEPTKGVPKIVGNPQPTLRADFNALADWVRDHVGESVPTANDLPAGTDDDRNWPGRTVYVDADDRMYVWKSVQVGWRVVPLKEVTVRFDEITLDSGILLVRHNLGQVPSWAQCTPQNTGVDTVSNVLSPIIWDSPITNANTLQVRFRNSATGGWLGKNRVKGFLTVGV